MQKWHRIRESNLLPKQVSIGFLIDTTIIFQNSGDIINAVYNSGEQVSAVYITENPSHAFYKNGKAESALWST